MVPGGTGLVKAHKCPQGTETAPSGARQFLQSAPKGEVLSRAVWEGAVPT